MLIVVKVFAISLKFLSIPDIQPINKCQLILKICWWISAPLADQLWRFSVVELDILKKNPERAKDKLVSKTVLPNKALLPSFSSRDLPYNFVTL